MKHYPSNKYLAKLIIFFVSIGFLILVALTALWLNQVVFNTDRFTKVTMSALSQPSSRESVGNLVASRVFENTPALRAVLGDRLASSIAGMLATDTATSSLERLSREGQLLFTSPRKDPIVLELTAFKPVIASIQSRIEPDQQNRRIDVNDIPDSITILNTTELPNFHQSALYAHLLGPAAIIAAVILASIWLYRGGRPFLYLRFQLLMLVLIGTACIAIIIGPLVEPAFVSIGRDAPSQTLLSNLYKAFTAPFIDQGILLGASALTVLSVTFVAREIYKRYRITVQITRKKR